MTPARTPPLTLEGWYVLHQFFHLSRPPAGERSPETRAETATGVADLLRGWKDLGERGWSAAYRIYGGGIDHMFLHFRRSPEDLGAIEATMADAGRRELLLPAFDYVSVVELGLYSATARTMESAREEGLEPESEEWDEALRRTVREEREKPYVQRRLYPRQPEEMPFVSFYPMDKRRRPGQNWYALPFEERTRLMAEHGSIGRTYAGRVSQVISGSIGMDDWEWAVTLFSGDPLEFKNLVTEMRYDPVSAEYAEFGPFYLGKRMRPEEWEEEI